MSRLNDDLKNHTTGKAHADISGRGLPTALWTNKTLHDPHNLILRSPPVDLAQGFVQLAFQVGHLKGYKTSTVENCDTDHYQIQALFGQWFVSTGVEIMVDTLFERMKIFETSDRREITAGPFSTDCSDLSQILP